MTDLPPIEYLDRAAVAHGWPTFATTLATDRNGIIAHARALQRIAELTADMPDQDVLDVRELLAVWFEDTPSVAVKYRSGEQDKTADFLATLATFRQIIARRGL